MLTIIKVIKKEAFRAAKQTRYLEKTTTTTKNPYFKDFKINER